MKLIARSETFISASLFGLSMLGVGFLCRYRTFTTQQALLKSPFDTPIPSIPHMRLQQKHLNERVIIIGDIHGCLEEFKLLLEKCKYNRNTSSVVLVGDLVNKGPYSAEVVKYARLIGAYSVKGNHDDVMLSYALKARNGDKIGIPDRYQYVRDFNDEDINWLIDMPYTLTLPEPFNCMIVHAGLIPAKPLLEQTAKTMCYLRNIGKSEETGEYIGYDQPKNGIPWIEEWNKHLELSSSSSSSSLSSSENTKKLYPKVYFGHDAKRGLQKTKYAVGLDTGCCYGKKLTAMVLPEQELVQVDAYKTYEEPGLRAAREK